MATMTVVLLCASGLNTLPSDMPFSDVEPDNGCGEAIGDIEANKPRAAPSSPVLLGLMANNGPEYLDMITTYEKEVIKFNRDNAGKGVREKLIAVYPQGGTILADHPFAILDGASWVSTEQVEAARLFREFLLSDEQQHALMQYGLRPADSSTGLIAPIDIQHGANPAANLVVLDVPDGLVIERAEEVWDVVEKQSDIILVFDKSRSMRGDKIIAAVNGAKAFVNAVDGEDWIAWRPFDDQVHVRTQGLKSKVGEAFDCWLTNRTHFL